MEFKKDDYVVLLKSCTGEDHWTDIPTNHVYQLKEDYTKLNFYIYRDLGGETTNGWSSKTYDSKMEVRAATDKEIMMYKILGHPFHISQATDPNYEIF